MVLDVIGLTGSTGVLGRHIKAVLKHQGLKVVEVNRLGRSSKNSWDLTEWQNDEGFNRILPNVGAIVHAGAIVPDETPAKLPDVFLANTNSCLNIGLWALSKDIPIIYISGGISYYNPHATNISEDAELGWSGLGGCYGLSKLLGEDSLKRLRKRGLNLAILRASSIYGAGMKSKKVISRFIESAVNDVEIELFPPVENTIDLIHAYDVSCAVWKILDMKKWTDFNVASGSMVSFQSLAHTCVELFGGGKVVEREARGATGFKKDTFNLNCDKARVLLDWSPSVDLKTGLKMMRQNKYLPFELQG